jgi:hypothetical protein
MEYVLLCQLKANFRFRNGEFQWEPCAPVICQDMPEVCTSWIIYFFTDLLQAIQYACDVEVSRPLALIGPGEDNGPITLVVWALISGRHYVVDLDLVTQQIDGLVRDEANSVLPLP